MPQPSPHQQGIGTEVPLRSFEPDGDPTSAGILLNASGARPTVKGFRPLRQPTPFGDPLPEQATGAIFAYYSDGTSSLIAGGPTHLWRYTGASVANADNFATLKPSGRWRFFQFGDDVVAVNPGVSPLVARGPTGTFATLGGNPPVGALTGTTASGTPFMFKGDQWYAGAAGVDSNWKPDVQTLAANGTLYDVPGPITAAAPFYGNVIVFKQTAAWIGSFVGGFTSWSWSLISPMIGAFNQESVIPLSDSIAFIGNDNFYLTSGSTPQPIPNKCAEWFFDNANPMFLSSIWGWYDEADSNLYWYFVSNDAPRPPLVDRFVCYSLRGKRWGVGSVAISCVAYPPSTVPSGGTGGESHIYFDLNNTPQTLNGDPAAMFLTTGYLGDADRLTQLYRVRFKWSFGSPSGPSYPAQQSLAAWGVNVLGQVPVPAATTPVLGNDGWINLRNVARYHQISIATSGDCEAVSFSYEGRVAGIR